jgi:hypothetical protein
MSKTIKLALFDPATEEFYVKDSNVFSKHIEKARLYTARLELRDTLAQVEYISKRDIKLVEIEVAYNVIGDSNVLETLIDEELQIKLQIFKELNVQAEEDIDAMPEKKYSQWKRLRNELRLTPKSAIKKI